MKLAPASPDEAGAMAALHAAAFDEAWDETAIRRLLDTPSAFAVLARDDDGAPIGFVLAWAPAAEAEILTLAVAPAARRKGAGAALTTAAIVAAMMRGADAMLLEVAEDNAAARALYEKLGFVETARRRSYYARPAGAADALVLRRAVPRPRV